MPILDWLLREHCPYCIIKSEWADLRRLPSEPNSLSERIEKAIDLYPCNILFVHRDAEREPRAVRAQEIALALRAVEQSVSIPPAVCVVPVRMQEAWLLFDEVAIRKASGNPNGKDKLVLPRLQRIESLANPKDSLYELLRIASGLNRRRRSKLQSSKLAFRISEFIEDFAPLRTLPAFQALETEVEQAIVQLNLH